MNNIKDKWALVTGSSRGIGQQIAIGLAKLGCNVVVHGRSKDNAQETFEQVKALGVACHAVHGELDSADGVEGIIGSVKELNVDIDILYNNAAINNTPTPIFDFTYHEWLKTFQVNLFSVVLLCNAFVPAMKARGWGRVVNMTSGIADQPQLAPYSVSKAAIDKFTKDLAFECKDHNVLVNHVDPGWIRTDLGGPDAWEPVESVIPGVLVPALLSDNGPTGRFYAAQDFKGLWD